MTNPTRTTPALAGLHIQPRDLDLLLDLFDCRLLSVSQAARLHFDGSQHVAYRRLRKLYRAGLLSLLPTKSLSGQPPRIYTFNSQTFAFLQAQGHLTQYTKADWRRQLRKRFSLSQQTIEHELAVLDVKASLQPTLSAVAGVHVVEFGTWPQAYAFEYQHEGKTRTQKPDGYLCLADHRHDFAQPRFNRFFLELDRGTQTLETLRAKVEAYRQFYRSGGFARWFAENEAGYRKHPLRVLIVFLSAERLANFARQLPADRRFEWMATLPAVRTDPLGPIWAFPKAFAQAPSPESPSKHGLLADPPQTRPGRSSHHFGHMLGL